MNSTIGNQTVQTTTINKTAEEILNLTKIVKAEAKEIFISECKNEPIPKANVIFKHMDSLSVSLHVMLVVMAAISVAMFIEELYFLRAHISSTYRRRLSLIQLGIPPVFCVTSVIGCFCPAGHVMIDFVTSVYFGIALHCLLVLMVNYYGGLKNFLRCFRTRKISIQTGPLCCFFFCIPQLAMTRKNFRILWYGTFQSAMIRPVTLFLKGVFDTDGSVHIPHLLYDAILITSMITGMWALVIFRRASTDFIGSYRIVGKFFIFQFVLLIANVQPTVIHKAYYSCIPPFTFHTRQIILNYQITTIEFFILALLSRCVYRRTTDNNEVNLPIEDPENIDESNTTNAAGDLEQLVLDKRSDESIKSSSLSLSNEKIPESN